MKKHAKNPLLQEINGPEYWQAQHIRREAIVQLARDWIDGKMTLDAEERSTLQRLIYESGSADLVLELYQALFRFNLGKYQYAERQLLEYEYDWLRAILERYPAHGKTLDRLLEICLVLQRVPDHYWHLLYVNCQQRVGKQELTDYIRRIGMLIQVIEGVPGDPDLKAAELVRLNSFHDFLQRMIPHPRPDDPFLSELGYSMEAICLVFMQVRFEGAMTKERLLADAEHWLAVEALENDWEHPRQAIPFQRLTAEEIDFSAFIGVKLPNESDPQKIYQQWANLKAGERGNALLEQMFDHAYRPRPEDFPFYEVGMTEAEVHTIAIRRLLEDYVQASIQDVRDGKVAFYSLSTHTSRVFDAGHEWGGARFWAIHHREKEVLSFLIASMTD